MENWKISNMVFETLAGYRNLTSYHHSESKQEDGSILASWVISPNITSVEYEVEKEVRDFIQDITDNLLGIFEEDSGEVPDLMPNTNPLTRILHKGDEGFTFIIHRHVMDTSILITYVHACLYL